MNDFFKDIELNEETKTLLQDRIKKIESFATENSNKILDSVGAHFEKKFEIPRLATETKLVDYIERAVTEIKDRENKNIQKNIQEDIGVKTQKIEELEKKIRDGISDEKLKLEIDKLKDENESLRVKFNDLNKDYETKIEVKNQELEKQKGLNRLIELDFVIDAAMPVFNKDANIFEIRERKKIARKFVKDNYTFKRDDKGELIKDNDGELILENKGTLSTNDKLKDILKENLKSILEKDNDHSGPLPPSENNHELNYTGDIKKDTEIINSYLSNKYKTKTAKGRSEAFLKLMKEAREMRDEK